MHMHTHTHMHMHMHMPCMCMRVRVHVHVHVRGRSTQHVHVHVERHEARCKVWVERAVGCKGWAVRYVRAVRAAGSQKCKGREGL